MKFLKFLENIYVYLAAKAINLYLSYRIWRYNRAKKFIEDAGFQVVRIEERAGSKYIVDNDGTFWRLKKHNL